MCVYDVRVCVCVCVRMCMYVCVYVCLVSNHCHVIIIHCTNLNTFSPGFDSFFKNYVLVPKGPLVLTSGMSLGEISVSADLTVYSDLFPKLIREYATLSATLSNITVAWDALVVMSAASVAALAPDQYLTPGCWVETLGNLSIASVTSGVGELGAVSVQGLGPSMDKFVEGVIDLVILTFHKVLRLFCFFVFSFFFYLFIFIVFAPYFFCVTPCLRFAIKVYVLGKHRGK